MRKLIRDRVLKRFNNQCCHCGSGDRLEVDHIIPVSKGGEHSEENFQILCKTCNLKKGSKLDVDIYFKKGDGYSFVYISTDFSDLNLKPNEFKSIIESKFKEYCEEIS